MYDSEVILMRYSCHYNICYHVLCKYLSRSNIFLILMFIQNLRFEKIVFLKNKEKIEEILKYM